MDDTRPTVRPCWARRVARRISGSVLGAVTVASGFGAGLATVGALLAVGTVGAGWLRARWPALPVVLLVAALVRFHAVPR